MRIRKRILAAASAIAITATAVCTTAVRAHIAYRDAWNSPVPRTWNKQWANAFLAEAAVKNPQKYGQYKATGMGINWTVIDRGAAWPLGGQSHPANTRIPRKPLIFRMREAEHQTARIWTLMMRKKNRSGQGLTRSCQRMKAV